MLDKRLSITTTATTVIVLVQFTHLTLERWSLLFLAFRSHCHTFSKGAPALTTFKRHACLGQIDCTAAPTIADCTNIGLGSQALEKHT